MQTFRGRCHCGNIGVDFQTALTPDELPLRACGCSFCRKHEARTTADPAGRARLMVRDAALLARYRFGHATADFLVCRACGVYLAAVLTEGPSAWAVLNVNAFDERDRFGRSATPVSYDGESADARRARRRERWTPVEIVEAASSSTA
jgi:hypothetical protein